MMSARVALLVGGGGERDARHVGITLVQHGQAQIVLAEIVAPLADAMRLVDGEQAEQPALVQRIELARKRGVVTRSGAAYSSTKRPGHHLALDALRVLQRERGVEEGGMHAGLFSAPTWSCISAISGSRRWPRRDRGGAHDRRHLVAQTLAAAGGHQHQGVAAGAEVVDDGRLLAAESRVAEDLVQDGERAEAADMWRRDGGTAMLRECPQGDPLRRP